MSRRAKSSAFADRLAADPEAAVLAVLRDAAGGLDARAIKARLRERGADAAQADAAWRRAQPKIRVHEHVHVEGTAYRWSTAARTVPPDEALDRIVRGGMSAAKRTELAAIVRAALRGAPTPPLPTPPAVATPVVDAPPAVAPQRAVDAPPVVVEERRPGLEAEALRERLAALTARCEELERRLDAGDTRSTELRQAQERQLKIDAIRALAELAMEVEELTANEAEPQVLIHRVRARVRKEGLEPIDRAGEETAFDRTRHKPIGGGIRDGETVSVVRPGYTWRTAGEDVLIGKAVVEE